MAGPVCLFEDRFVVRSVDSSKFERVSRIRGKSTGYDAELVLDINSDLFPVRDKESIYVGVTNSLSTGSGRADAEDPVWDKKDLSSSLSEYDYIMYGKIFKLDEQSSERRVLYASFGGLLMALTADKTVLSDLELEMRVYLLVKRADAIPID